MYHRHQDSSNGETDDEAVADGRDVEDPLGDDEADVEKLVSTVENGFFFFVANSSFTLWRKSRYVGAFLRKNRFILLFFKLSLEQFCHSVDTT